jgi:hypothetical protein
MAITVNYQKLLRVADEGRKYQDLKDRFVVLTNNERGLADAYHDAVHIDELDPTRGRSCCRSRRAASALS